MPTYILCHKHLLTSAMLHYLQTNHPEGGWVVNKAELDLLHSTYKEFFEGGEKYPDEA